jgi:hypothetical protein
MLKGQIASCDRTDKHAPHLHSDDLRFVCPGKGTKIWVSWGNADWYDLIRLNRPQVSLREWEKRIF